MNNLKTYVSALELQTNLREDDVKFYVLNVKALVGAINQEKALVGAFTVIVKTDCETDGALHSTT